MKMLKMKTEKGVTSVEIAGKRIDTGKGKQGIREAVEIVSTQLFMAIVRGDKVFTKLPKNAVTRLVPAAINKTNITYSIGEEETVSDRVIHITA